jgi:hypothetical protein
VDELAAALVERTRPGFDQDPFGAIDGFVQETWPDADYWPSIISRRRSRYAWRLSASLEAVSRLR